MEAIMAAVLVVTMGRSVYLAPELYTASRRASLEAVSLLRRLSPSRKPASVQSPCSMPFGRGLALHLHELPMEDSWRACPLWLGVVWLPSKATPSFTLMPADNEEALNWLAEKSGAAPTTSIPDCLHEAVVVVRKRERYVSVQHIKQIRSL